MDNLNGKKVGGRGYERALARDVFRKPEEWVPLDGSNVRAPMSNLRDFLEKYYRTEADDDEVRITFPKGDGYVACFVYGRDKSEKESVQRLADAFSRVFPDLARSKPIVRAMEAYIFDGPSDAPSCAIVAEAVLAYGMCDETDSQSMQSTLGFVERAVKAGMRLDDTVWRLHAMAGAIHSCRFAWEKADASFQTALRMAPDEARAHFWYAAFLLAVGRTKEALESIDLRRTRPLGRLTPYIRTLFLYIGRQSRNAYWDLRSMRKSMRTSGVFPGKWPSDRLVPVGSWPGEILAGFLYATLGEAWDVEAMPLGHIQERMAKGLEYTEAGVAHSKIGAFDCLRVIAQCNVLTLNHGNEYYDGKNIAKIRRSLFVEIARNRRRQGPVSLALACLGMGKKALAISYLKRGCDIGHPLMMWLHLWPFFDSLREEPRFRALVKKMNLPG